MSIKVRERDVESYLVSHLEAIGIQCVKFSPEHRNGMPDRLILLPDQRCIWAELKTDTGRHEELQKYQRRKLEQSGQRVEVIWTKKDADALINEIKQDIKKTSTNP